MTANDSNSTFHRVLGFLAIREVRAGGVGLGWYIPLDIRVLWGAPFLAF